MNYSELTTMRVIMKSIHPYIIAATVLPSCPSHLSVSWRDVWDGQPSQILWPSHAWRDVLSWWDGTSSDLRTPR